MSDKSTDRTSWSGRELRIAADKVRDLNAFRGSRIVELSASAHTLLADAWIVKPDDYYAGTQLLRQLLALFNFDESRVGGYRFEHKLVQALVLNSYIPGLVPVTLGAAEAIAGLTSYQASARVKELSSAGFLLKPTVGEASGELGPFEVKIEPSQRLVDSLEANYKGTLESETYVFQRRLNICKEYRVHTFQDAVIQDLTFYRYSSVIPSSRNLARINSFLQEILGSLPNALVRDSMYGWDVAEDENGHLTVIEANPTGIHLQYRPGFHCSGYFQVPAWSVPCLGRFCLFLNSHYGCDIQLVAGRQNTELSNIYRLVALYATNRYTLKARHPKLDSNAALSLTEVLSTSYSASFELNTLCWIVAENKLQSEDEAQPESGVHWASYSDACVNKSPDEPPPAPASQHEKVGSCIHELVEEQVRRSPESIAVCWEGLSVTYSEIDEWANGIAEMLVARGVGPEKLVAICITRSPLLIAAMLGVLKSGGVYVPVDPNISALRLAEFLIESSPQLLVTTHQLGARFGSRLPRGRTLILKETAVSRISENKVNTGVTDHSLCYVLYTSGSTGKPKGVMVEHKSVVNQLLWMQAEFPLHQDDVILCKTPYTFDVSVWDIFWPLISGARVIIAKPDGQVDQTYLVELISRQGVTVIQFVPSMLQIFMNAMSTEALVTLRLLLSIGEVLPTKLAMQVRKALPNMELVNLYGPTETAVAVTAWRCTDVVEGQEIPIGRPMNNVEVYIVNGSGNLVSGGEEGEIYIGGVQVARGYRKNLEQTQQKFVMKSFSGASVESRLYATGDRGRWRDESTLEYLGRDDDQIKFYGHRIDPRDIEVVIEELPTIQRAVVIHLDVTDGDNQIIAFCLLEKSGVPGTKQEDIAMHLAKQLPPALVPSKYIIVDEVPTNSTGKIDRKALAARAKGEFLAVADNVNGEHSLACVLSSFLAPHEIEMSLSLVEGGLDSLSILRFANKIRKVFGCEIDMGWLFTPEASLLQIAAALSFEGVSPQSYARAVSAVQGD